MIRVLGNSVEIYSFNSVKMDTENNGKINLKRGLDWTIKVSPKQNIGWGHKEAASLSR